MGDNQLGQGAEAVKELLKSDTDLRKKVYAGVKKAAGL